MSLLDDLRNLLARHLAHTQSQTQQGTVRWIEDHLERLDAVVSSDIAAGEAKVHEILGELYAATNAPTAAEAPSTPSVPDPTSEPVGVSEAGPELPPSTAATSDAAPAVDPAPAPAEPVETTTTAETDPAA